VLLLSIRLKRRWRRQDEPDRRRPENLLIAIYGFLGTALVFAATQFFIRGYINWAPILFALNQGIAGYFVGVYIDRSMAAKERCLALPATQAGLQFVGTLLAALSSTPPGVVLTPAASVVMALWFASQSAMAGFVLGVLFQYLYRRTELPTGGEKTDVKLYGDLAVQARPRSGG
jgi:hypothetical protein